MNSSVNRKGPDFFIVGAPKCGTTAMTHYLGSHPDIFFPADKEFHYFGSDIKYEDVFRNVRDKDKYFAQFNNADPDQLVGETSTWNLYSSKAAREIHEYNSEAKIIVMLRNPVDMLHSLHSHYLYGGNEEIEDFEEALRAEDHRKQGECIPETARFIEGLYYREVADYAPQLERYLSVFDEDQLQIIVFDDLVSETVRIYRETLRFLGVSTAHEPDFERINPSKTVYSQALNRFVRNPPEPVKSLVQFVDQSLPAWLFRNPVRKLYRIVNTKPRERPGMDDELREELKREFKPMIQELESLIDRDLRDWYA